MRSVPCDQSPATDLATSVSVTRGSIAVVPIRIPWKERQTKNTETRKNTSARMRVNVASPLLRAVKLTASSTASNPNSVVNLITGFIATDEVSLNGSPTVSPTTVASCRAVPFIFRSTSTTFFALSHAPPALAIKIAWYKPKIAIEIRYPIKKNGSTNANASVEKNTVRKILNMPFCAYCVQICTTFLLSSTDAFSTPSSRMFALMNSTARYAPVVTACVDAPVNQ